MDLPPAGSIQNREGFHKVHVRIQSFAITSVKTPSGEGSIRFQVFEVATVKRIGTMDLEQIERKGSKL